MYNITFHQIAMFLEVAKRLNITAVAEDMYISQAALSKMIQRLEEGLDIQLFNRGRRGLTLTAQGRLLYNRLQAPFGSICNSIAEVQALNSDRPMSLKIGYLTTIDMNSDYAKLNAFIHRYKAKHPEIIFYEELYSFDKLRAKLKYGDVDLIFIPNFELYNIDDDTIESRALLRYQIFVAAGNTNPAVKSGSLNLEILKHQPLYTIGSSFSNTISEYLESITGRKVDDISKIELPNTDTLIRTLKNGRGFAILGQLKFNDSDGIRLYSVSDMVYTISLHMAWRNDNENIFLHKLIKSLSENIVP